MLKCRSITDGGQCQSWAKLVSWVETLLTFINIFSCLPLASKRAKQQLNLLHCKLPLSLSLSLPISLLLSRTCQLPMLVFIYLFKQRVGDQKIHKSFCWGKCQRQQQNRPCWRRLYACGMSDLKQQHKLTIDCHNSLSIWGRQAMFACGLEGAAASKNNWIRCSIWPKWKPNKFHI